MVWRCKTGPDNIHLWLWGVLIAICYLGMPVLLTLTSLAALTQEYDSAAQFNLHGFSHYQVKSLLVTYWLGTQGSEFALLPYDNRAQLLD